MARKKKPSLKPGLNVAIGSSEKLDLEKESSDCSLDGDENFLVQVPEQHAMENCDEDESLLSARRSWAEEVENLQSGTDEEEWEIDKSLSITIAKFNLRGRLCPNTEHNRGFLNRVLGGIWQLKETEWNIKIKEKFDSESIQNRVLSQKPWYLSNGLLILGKMENSNESWKNDLTNFPIWGKAIGVPIDFLTKNNTVKMATKSRGDVSKIVADGFFRFRVDNGCRDGFEGKILGMEQYDPKGDLLTRKSMGWRM
ncbi:hypothetical protein F8388_011318 [Cannabis sativa]|uniref:DUF4283 domain-containing protein n=1 Tax=Cannabis sativa TaxID=3483 RepID=A0A7J6FAK3_CANSA|nr:hypothetical protein F8388_011318 [Cannabis sativa]